MKQEVDLILEIQFQVDLKRLIAEVPLAIGSLIQLFLQEEKVKAG